MFFFCMIFQSKSFCVNIFYCFVPDWTLFIYYQNLYQRKLTENELLKSGHSIQFLVGDFHGSAQDVVGGKDTEEGTAFHSAVSFLKPKVNITWIQCRFNSMRFDCVRLNPGHFAQFSLTDISGIRLVLTTLGFSSPIGPELGELAEFQKRVSLIRSSKDKLISGLIVWWDFNCNLCTSRFYS